MAVTLAQLMGAPGIGLRVLAGAAGPPTGLMGAAGPPTGLRRAVTWVAVSELPDPTPYLEGGELVLLTGLSANLEAGARDYVNRLVRAEVTAVGLGVGVVHPQVPSALIEAADEAGLPLVEVDRPTPFIAVGKALADLMAVQNGERTRRRLDGMRALTAQLAQGTEPVGALRRVATLVDGWAALLDSRARVIAVAGRRARPEVALRLAAQVRGRPGFTSAADADGLGRVTVLPLGLRERAHGFLAVGVGPGADLDHHLVAFAASLFTLDREHARGTREVRRWVRAAALAAWIDGAAPAVPAGSLGPLTDSGTVRAIVLHRGLDLVWESLDDEDSVAGLALDGDRCLLVVAEAEAGEVLQALDRPPDGDRPLLGGVSDPHPVADLSVAVAQARSLAVRARDGILRTGAGAPSLLDLIGAPAAAAFAETALAALRADPDGAVLEDTLRAYLTTGGGLAAAAEDLGVHRHTLRARLRRIGVLLGRDLEDPATRAELWVAVTAAPTRLPAATASPLR